MKQVTLLSLCAAVVLSGCSMRHGDFTVVSNKMVRLSDFELDTTKTTKKVVGEDVQHIILFIPTASEPTLDGAMDDIFSRADGDVITDAVIESWGWYIPYIYGQRGWRVTGDVVKTRKN